MIDSYLKTTAEAIKEILKSDEDICLVSVKLNPKARKYKYELRTYYCYEIKDTPYQPFTNQGQPISDNERVEKILNECNVDYFKESKSACATAFEFIVSVPAEMGVKIVCSIPEIE